MTAQLRLVVADEQFEPPLLRHPVHYLGTSEEGITELAAEPLRTHLARHGTRPDCRDDATAGGLVDELERIRLAGRGGGHFPAAAKWRAMRDNDAAARVVIANGAEGEPQSRKDLSLLELRPHLVLDGLACAAETVRADEAVVWLHESAHLARAVIARALAERTAARLDEPPMRVALGRDHYLTGESSAAVEGVAGRTPLPAFRRGPAVSGAPAALVHNVETLARVGLAARGADAGDTVLVSVAAPDSIIVLELPDRCTVQEGVRAALGDAPRQAVLVGGYGGSWLSWDDAASVGLRQSRLRAAGLSLGAGVLGVLDPGECGLGRAAEIVRYLADSSARQCGPCLFGLEAIATSMATLVRGGRRSRREAARIEGFLAEVSGRGACHHPDGATRMVASALTVFADDVAAHVHGRRCLHGGGRRG